MSLPYFPSFGWNPIVLAAQPDVVEGVLDPLLLDTIPQDIQINRVSALPCSLTRRVGLGDLGIRAFPFLPFLRRQPDRGPVH